jgi:hypothetical protein
MNVSYETARSLHRTTGRPAKRWTRETGEVAPIRLEDTDYKPDPNHGGWRTTYRLPAGVADEIAAL